MHSHTAPFVTGLKKIIEPMLTQLKHRVESVYNTPCYSMDLPRNAKSLSIALNTHTVHSLYNIPHYNIDLDITRSCGSQFSFFHGILQRKYRKMTIRWSFSYYSFVKLSLYNLFMLWLPSVLPFNFIKE